MTDFFINVIEDSVYPSSSDYFNPDFSYPEYIWSPTDISKNKNCIYEMVRNCLIGLKLDAVNVNKKEWNPLGDFIKEGDTVLIKPNWVMHYNKNKKVTENSLECLITHPSVVRAVIDYCLIALKNTGKIIIGDAPMQGCNLDILLKDSGYNDLFSFYTQHFVDLKPNDFRQYSTLVDKNKVLLERKFNSNEAFEIKLDERSRFNLDRLLKKKYKVSDYNEKVTNSFHNNCKHSYLINKDVLSADVVINLCKPKCHRLAGITAGIKNFVGITYDKACLPHRTSGSKQQGGDEYMFYNPIKELISRVLDAKLRFEEQKMFRLSLLMRYTYGFLYYLMKSLSRDKNLIGSWYGNDTVWRMSLDLYHILLYTDKSGSIHNEKQRIIFNLADMIISGEGNGPVSPEPKKLGVIIAGYDAVMLDRLICEIMGFDPLKIPMIHNAEHDLIQKNKSDYVFGSNLTEYNEKSIEELNFPAKWRFKPYNTWKGFIEKV